MITRKFIEKVHDAFDELNYHETKELDSSKFVQSFAKTLTHCKELSDAISAVRLCQFCLKKWKRIEKIFERKLDVFNSFVYEGNSLISVVPDDAALGTYYITNGLNDTINDVFVASHSFDTKIFAFGCRNGKYTVFDDGKYYISYSKKSSDKMKLFEKSDKLLCNIVLSENLGIFLENEIFENSATPYELVAYDNFIGIYDRTYIKSLASDDIIDTANLLAAIEWDILKENSYLGMARLVVFAPDQDLEMLLLFAASTFLAYQHYTHEQKKEERKKAFLFALFLDAAGR